MCLLLIAAVLVSTALAQCPYAYTPLNGGTLCSATSFCQALGGTGYECMNGQCCRINGLCNADEISVGYQCLKVSYEGGSCVNSVQCLPNGSLQCVNGICSRLSADNGVTCSKPGQVAERSNGALANCMYNACSVGFGCEYNQGINQYICCGVRNAQNDYSYAPPVTYAYDAPNSIPSGSSGTGECIPSNSGQVRMYPGSSLPLKCYGSSDCLFDNTPNCVNSQRYGYFVCCSTYNC